MPSYNTGQSAQISFDCFMSVRHANWFMNLGMYLVLSSAAEVWGKVLKRAKFFSMIKIG